MNLKSLIEYVMDEYPIDKNNTKFANNQIAKILRNGLNKIVPDYVLMDYYTVGSPGKGNWATVPWIGIFDTNITKSATKGFYIVYLFSADMQKTYLCLMQGYTRYNKRFKTKGNEYIRLVTKYFQHRLGCKDNKISNDLIDLKSNAKLPKGYELGAIYHFSYSKSHLPDNDRMLKDLLTMIEYLRDTKQIMYDPTDVDNSINYILKITSNYESYDLDKENNNIHIHTDIKHKKYLHLTKNIDYIANEEENSKVGFLGEQKIMDVEKNKLNRLRMSDLANKVEQVSITQGDGLGYDIHSFDEKGNDLYVEVKSTTGDKNSNFYITSNELKAMKKISYQYVIARVYFANKRDWNYFYIDGDIESKLNLYPTKYQASIR
ncbi:MrcB family domain-containing protein [Apilactobacillus quenuiae]|uniref:MrcB family domain-containing protein n=1 Tax=Apilactobacillus quenuiae TaxID=2008377 RepID=UPI000D0187F0|nr:DUF3578 domain-containing protein [Apilactobacillus quenuiae]